MHYVYLLRSEPAPSQTYIGLTMPRLPESFLQAATRRGHVWTWDFIYDRTLRGGTLRTLTVVDGFTR